MLIIALLYLLLPLLSLAHFNVKPNYLAAPIEHGETVMLVATLALGAFALAQLMLLGADDAANTGVCPSSGSRYVAICNILLLLGTFSLIINRWLDSFAPYVNENSQGMDLVAMPPYDRFLPIGQCVTHRQELSQ